MLGKENEFLGMLMLNDIRDKMFNQKLLDTTFVEDYYTQAHGIIDYQDLFERIMDIFDETQSWYLPVMKDGKFAGVISKTKLYSEYRRLMVKLSDE